MNRHVHTGFLRKEGKLNKSLKKRWFALHDKRLFYFDPNNKRRVLGQIDLERTVIQETKLFPETLRNKENVEFVFEIATTSRVYYLVSDTRQEMIEWINYLREQSTETEDENHLILLAEQAVHKEIRKRRMIEEDRI
eukprot:TRINITY_DN6695_c0_g2_i1.p1 TRINITY_DN6695_c0_g2~~TRINITY_DN6695_c0_g2_i1.p1  ORF type:complete len:137 (-),score=23.18 TRINITY_DN6695_c0_g2_i1:88-498(-)